MPKLSDPAEYELIKKIYFDNDFPSQENIDPIERLERQEAKQRNKQKNNR